jgi:threonine dehydrogenase-like Zn-dependent dehydrogenase
MEVTPNDAEVLVKVSSCGLCNWELNHWIGNLGVFPQSVGHEWTGIIAEKGKKVRNLKVGQRVTGLSDHLDGFSEYLTVSEDLCCIIDPQLKTDYTFGEPLKCVVTILRALGVTPGDIGIVAGCGPMGLWCIQLLGGCFLSDLIAMDTNDQKLELAKSFGATVVVNPTHTDSVRVVSSLSKGRMADFVIDVTGSPKVLNEQVHLLKQQRPRLVIASSHATASNLDFRPLIERGAEIHIPHPHYSQDQIDDLRRAVSLINKQQIIIDPLVTHIFCLEEIERAFDTMENKPKSYIKGAIRIK